MKRYLSFIQDLCQVPNFREVLAKLAETEQVIKVVKGFLRARPGM
jgi:hypothetical protein